MIFSLLSRLRHETVKDKDIEMLSRFIQLLLALDSPGRCGIMIQTSAKLS
jgi:hypothetical protein